MHIVGSKDHVHVARPLLDEIPVLLGETSRHSHLQVGSGLLRRLQVAQSPVEPVVGVLPDAAGVQDDHIGVGLSSSRNHAICFEKASDALAVVLVHLAPVGTQGIGPTHALQARSCTP